MPVTNTLETSRRLEKLGFPHDQAQGLADILEETARIAQPDLSHIATKTDLGVLESRVETRLKELELRIAERLRAQMVWIFGMLVGLLGVTIAILKLFP